MLLVSEDLDLGQELTLEELLMRGHLFCLIALLKLIGTGKLKVNSLILLWKPHSVLSSNAYWACPLKPSLPDTGISGNHVFRRFCIRPHISSILSHLVTKWRVTMHCSLGVIVLCTSYTEMCRKCLCLTSAFCRDRLQYLHLPEASAGLLIEQEELWLRIGLLDLFYFYSWALLYNPEVFWFSLSENSLAATFQKQSWKRASTFYTSKPRYAEFSAKSNFCPAIYSHWDPLTKLQY